MVPVHTIPQGDEWGAKTACKSLIYLLTRTGLITRPVDWTLYSAAYSDDEDGRAADVHSARGAKAVGF